MSGGKWGYQNWQIEEQAEAVHKFLRAVAASERLIDWAECGDTTRRDDQGNGAEKDLYDLWLKTFNEVYGDD